MLHPTQNAYNFGFVPQSRGLIIFVHGLTSSKDEKINLQAEKFFSENNYSTIRFNLYGDLPGEKKFSHMSLKDHIQGVNEVINFYKSEGFKKIFLVGHSYGGIVNLYVNHENISGILMRDPSIGGQGLLEDVHEDESGKHYIDWGDGYRHYISEKLFQDFQIPSEEFLEKLKEIKIPIKIVSAENGLSRAAKRYYEVANEPKELSIIKGENHTFQNGGLDELLKESLTRIDQN